MPCLLAVPVTSTVLVGMLAQKVASISYRIWGWVPADLAEVSRTTHSEGRLVIDASGDSPDIVSKTICTSLH